MCAKQYLTNTKTILFLLFIVFHFNLGAQSKPQLQIRLQQQKAKKDYSQMAATYKALLYRADTAARFAYADSMLSCAEKTKDPAAIGAAFLTKGTLYYNRKDHLRALDNFIWADNYIAKTNDEYLKYKTKYTIAQIKSYLGFYDEAIALFKECLTYFEEENDLAYLNTLHSIGLAYNHIGKYDLCSYYNQLGLKTAAELQKQELQPYFIHSEGINQYSKKKYKEAISSLTEAIPALAKKKDFAALSVANGYLGQAYWALGKKEKAVPYLLKVDEIFSRHQYIKPELRKNYELLIDYYKEKNNPQAQLAYINKLLKIDRILEHDYKYLSQKIFKEYDTKKLLLEKEAVQKSLATNKRWYYAVIILLLGTLIGLSIRYRIKQKQLKLKFDELMSQKPETASKTNNNIELDLNPELVQNILKNLKKFEAGKKYLEKDMGLNKLALHLKTNPKYASKIILKYRNKKSIEYITELKIEHTIELLKTQNKYRNYTYKALAEEVGFGSTQNFTKAFKTITGMPPAYFIQNLKKNHPL